MGLKGMGRLGKAGKRSWKTHETNGSLYSVKQDSAVSPFMKQVLCLYFFYAKNLREAKNRDDTRDIRT